MTPPEKTRQPRRIPRETSMPVKGEKDQPRKRTRRHRGHPLITTLVMLSALLAVAALSGCGGNETPVARQQSTPAQDPTQTTYIPAENGAESQDENQREAEPPPILPEPTATQGYIFQMPERATPEPTTQQTTLNPDRTAGQESGKIVVELRMGPGGNGITARPWDKVQLTLTVVYDDGSERMLDPREEGVVFKDEEGRNSTPNVSAAGVVEIGRLRGDNRVPDNRNFSATYQGKKARKSITVKDLAPAPPAVDQRCMYQPRGSGQTVKADTVVITMWIASMRVGLTKEMKAAGVEKIGAIDRDGTHYPQDNILAFPCNSLEDLQRAWTAIYQSPTANSIELYPITGASAEVAQISIGYMVKMGIGSTRRVSLLFTYEDGSRRYPSQEQKDETKLTSADPSVVQATGGLDYMAVQTGITTLQGNYGGKTADLMIEVKASSIDRDCRGWHYAGEISGTTIIGYSGGNILLLELHREYGRDTAQQIAQELGATLMPGHTGPDETPTYTLDLNIVCNPLAQTLDEMPEGNHVSLRDLNKDPRVSDADHPTGWLRLRFDLAELQVGDEADYLWSKTELSLEDVSAMSAYIHDPKNISPLNEIVAAPYVTHPDGERWGMTERMRSSVRVTSSDERVAWVVDTPEREDLPTWQMSHQKVIAGRPGQATLTFEIEGQHTALVPVTVQPPLAVFPEVPDNCTQEIRGIRYSASRMVLTLLPGDRILPEHANAIGGNVSGSVVASTQDGRTHMIQGRCPRQGQIPWYQEIWGSNYAEISSVHMQIISIDGVEPEAGPRDLSP